MVKKVISKGIHDFKELIEGNCYYVDKTMFIHEFMAKKPDKVTIIPRPRRFGKTLNMTMLQYFFEKPFDGSSNAHLFEGLAITNYPEIMARQGTYPVIFITFKGIKSSTWDECYKEIKAALVVEFKRHTCILQSEKVSDSDKKIFVDIIEKKADMHDYKYALAFLSTLLWNVHQAKPIILIDEYDAPMQAGFEFKYYEEIKNFMYGFFCAGLKDNNNLEFAVITGILRVAKDSIFSGMNNTANYSLLSDVYADKFGFTHDEVATIHEYYKLPFDIAEIKKWYNGYSVGSEKEDGTFTTIYNPWSIIECASNKKMGPFWINTGGHFLIQEAMFHASANDKQDLIDLLEGHPVTKTINDTIVFNDIYRDSTTMWSFLVFTGYLTWSSRNDRLGKTVAQLAVPNFEVIDSLKNMIMGWFIDKRCEHKIQFEQMVSGIRDGAPKTFLTLFRDNVLASMSYFDLGIDGESVYQAFTLGILVSLADTHEITTNRESGYGRYDLCIIPKDPSQPGMIIEFKRRKIMEKGALSTFAKVAFEQIELNRYDVEMKKRGIKRICKIGISFQGKHMAWKFQVQDGDVVVEKGSYSDERAAKRARRIPGKK